jgi:hypothetical protein
MLPLAAILPPILTKRGLAREVLAFQVVTEASRILDRLLPRDLRSRARVRAFQYGTVFVDCTSNTLAYEIRCREPEILQGLIGALPASAASCLRVHVASFPDENSL